jgi:copper chaperone CopZ
MMRLRVTAAVAVVLLPAVARADRTQVFSIQAADCGSCGDVIKAELKKLDGVKKADFDKEKAELKVKVKDDVTDEQVLAAIGRAGLRAVVGAGQGSYASVPAPAPELGFVTLSHQGEAIGPLAKHRVPGKWTVFDVYAEWCAPCRLVDARLRELAGARADLAVRKLNVVSFETPLALELGAQFEYLPYMVVFSPEGERTDIHGADLEKLDRTLAGR